MIIPFNKSPKGVNHQIEEFFDLLQQYTDELPSGSNVNPELRILLPGGLEETLNGFAPLSGCGKVFDISRYIPLWVVYEKTDDPTKTNAVSVFDFVQKYYDWLYCDNTDGAQYMLSENLLDLIDIEKTRSEFFNRYIFTLVDGLDENILIDNGGIVTSDSFIKFIKGIRKQFYHRKTTIDGLKYFFKTLFAVSEDEIYVYEPKENLLRLNGGRFVNNKFSFVGSTGDYSSVNSLAGSYLNNARFHDNDWIQEYSYLLSVGITSGSYIPDYLNAAHPIGIKVVFERKITDYIAPSDDVVTDNVCEVPVLKNYAAYSINTSYTSQIATAPDGSALFGLTACIGCTGYTGFTGPTYYFPNWIDTITQTKFNDINIFDFFNLCLENGVTSPNEPLTCTGC